MLAVSENDGRSSSALKRQQEVPKFAVSCMEENKMGLGPLHLVTPENVGLESSWPNAKPDKISETIRGSQKQAAKGSAGKKRI